MILGTGHWLSQLADFSTVLCLMERKRNCKHLPCSMAQDIWSCPLVRDAPTGWRIVDAGISISWLTILYIKHIFPCFLWVWRSSQPGSHARYTACLSVISWSDFTNISRHFYPSKFSASLSKKWAVMATINKPCCCFNSHNAGHSSQVAHSGNHSLGSVYPKSFSL